MTRQFILSLLLGALMVCSAGLTKFITPDIYLSSARPPESLESIIPTQFGNWKEEKKLSSAIVMPQREELIKKLYTETLSRTYVNENGERIMLSIAYGADQRDANAVHYPEVCYPAQGFQIRSDKRGTIETPHGTIAVKRLETNLTSQRYEPVTYWTTIGDFVIKNAINKKIIEMKYGLKRQIPDGMIFRVSSIDVDANHAFLIQNGFVNALLDALSSNNKKRLAGLT